MRQYKGKGAHPAEAGDADRPSPPTPSPPRDRKRSRDNNSPAAKQPEGRGGYDIRSFLLHQDATLLAFDKPAGLAVQGGSGVTQSLESLLTAFAKSNGKVPRLVHRLDRETSGVIVAARTKPAAAFLSDAFAWRSVPKTYFAIVCGGAPEPAEGEIAFALKKSSRHGLDIMEVAATGGQAALTRYRTLAATPTAALLELTPETGRMHQLRAHLAAIGHPIAGDGKYGGFFRLGATEVPTLMLHAARLDIPHPAGGRLVLEAPPPAAFRDVAVSLGLDSALAR
ncbi:MAG: RluA family pseudouridine synthase [Terricaulis sp.]